MKAKHKNMEVIFCKRKKKGVYVRKKYQVLRNKQMNVTKKINKCKSLRKTY